MFVSIGVTLNAQQYEQERIISDRLPKSADVNKEVKLETTSKSTTISIRAGESQVTHNSAYYQNEIDKIDAQILAINTKISIVNANSEEKQVALNSGWFTDMENIKIQLENKKQEFQAHLD